jgi:hypothetical protein
LRFKNATATGEFEENTEEKDSEIDGEGEEGELSDEDFMINPPPG